MKKTYSICIMALFAALTYIATTFIRIPIPLGYAHIGNSVIIFASVICGPVVGLLAGAIGSSLADLLTGYVMWAPFTFVIKVGIGIIAGYMAGRPDKQNKVRIFAGAVVSMIFMVVAYTVSGMILYGSAEAGLSQVPGLAAEGVVNIAVFYILYYALKRVGLNRKLSEMFN